MRVDSTEIRWFFKGEPAESLESWFQQAPLGLREETRTDYYLFATGPTLTVKLRNGSLESKQREWIEPGTRFGNGLSGQLEGWSKWSFELKEDGDTLRQVAAHPEAWIAVRKRRLLRVFAPAGEGMLEQIPNEAPPAGCQVELSYISTGRRKYYTLGLEAYGAGADLKSMLLQTAGIFFNSDFPLTLTADFSMGYAAWIAANR